MVTASVDDDSEGSVEIPSVDVSEYGITTNLPTSTLDLGLPEDPDERIENPAAHAGYLYAATSPDVAKGMFTIFGTLEQLQEFDVAGIKVNVSCEYTDENPEDQNSEGIFYTKMNAKTAYTTTSTGLALGQIMVYDESGHLLPGGGDTFVPATGACVGSEEKPAYVQITGKVCHFTFRPPLIK